MMLECKEAVVQAICVTIAEKTVLQFLGSLNIERMQEARKDIRQRIFQASARVHHIM